MAEPRRHVAEGLGDGRAVLVVDARTFPKTGSDPCGVGRQWCGRLGKQENCQCGIFLAYAAPGEYAPLERRLYPPEDWAGDAARRARCRVPEGVEFRAGWRIAAELVERCGEGLPHCWVVAADEFGRPAHFRAWLRGRGERYVLDVPSNTVVRDLERPRPRVAARGTADPGRSCSAASMPGRPLNRGADGRG
jgi:SRSO17 transposase